MKTTLLLFNRLVSALDSTIVVAIDLGRTLLLGLLRLRRGRFPLCASTARRTRRLRVEFHSQSPRHLLICLSFLLLLDLLWRRRVLHVAQLLAIRFALIRGRWGVCVAIALARVALSVAVGSRSGFAIATIQSLLLLCLVEAVHNQFGDGLLGSLSAHSPHLAGPNPYLLARQIMTNLLLELLSYALGGYGIEVGVGQDIVNDGAVGRVLFERYYKDILVSQKCSADMDECLQERSVFLKRRCMRL